MDMDTRSDIYSLGVLLYELLTGTTPFDTKELLRPAWMKCAESSGNGNQSVRAPGCAQLRGPSEIQNPKPKIEHDLDWIVMKCLEKDRNQRYQTARDLQLDLERWLNGEAVLARRPGRFYRLQKAVRRNKLTFAALAAVVLALLGGLGVSSWIAATGAQGPEAGRCCRAARTSLARASRHP